MVTKIKQRQCSVKAGPDDGLKEGEFLVYPSTFIRQPDAYGDVVAKGAFEKTIQKWKDAGLTMPGLFGHRLDDPDFYVASALDMGEDDHGWWVKGEFDMESPKGPHVYRLVKGKRLNQLSFAYDTISEGQVQLDDDTKANELRELDVFEFSFVPLGANQDTGVVAVKSATEALNAYIARKEGRTLSEENLEALRTVHQTIGSVISAAEGEEEEDDAKASGAPGANEEDPNRGNSEELAGKARSARAEALTRITNTFG